MNNNASFWNQLPPDIVVYILTLTGSFSCLGVLASTCKGLRAAVEDEDVWHSLATQHWGHHTPDAVPFGGWKAWCLPRLPVCRIKQSPLNLLQEAYNDPWKHIVACVLCSRTSGSSTIVNTIASFFEAFPTPSAVLDAEDVDIKALIHPLGLQPVRSRAVRDISAKWFGSWDMPDEFFGCGTFVRDSYRIFCKQDTSGAGVQDANLRRYCAWLNRSLSPICPPQPKPTKLAHGRQAGGSSTASRCPKGQSRRQMGPGAAAASVEGGAARRSGRLQQVQQQEHQLPASTSAHPLNKRRRNVADPQLVAASNHDTQEGVAKSQALERPTKRSRKGLRQLPSQQQAASASSLQKRIPIKRATGSELQALSS